MIALTDAASQDENVYYQLCYRLNHGYYCYDVIVVGDDGDGGGNDDYNVYDDGVGDDPDESGAVGVDSVCNKDDCRNDDDDDDSATGDKNEDCCGVCDDSGADDGDDNDSS
ncbi:secreted acidic protein 1A-like [Mercenaria mercenaria]|uniref:secreted acidic protein 1A-like n=1 Tax=Mercenaria mercenaria TaxID=6596 RepID=UPI00234F0AA8|nr:secreted acidic protein 1A-like [Mercenaria mercenaria]